MTEPEQPEPPAIPEGPSSPIVEKLEERLCGRRGADPEARSPGGGGGAGTWGDSDVDEVRIFYGHLGGNAGGERVDWRLFYLDASFNSWLIVHKDAIVAYNNVKDDGSPFGSRDVIWVDSQASVIPGRNPQEIDGRFLSGDLVRAGDVEVPPTGGTFGAGQGVFYSPNCCTPRSRR